MSNETLLYICGIVLAVSAVTTCFVGLKFPDFPGKAFPVVILWFAIFVVGSTTFAVLHAKDEDKARAAEYKEAGEKAEKEETQTPKEGASKGESEGESGESAEGEEAGGEEGESMEGGAAAGEEGESMEGGESEGGESAEASAGGNPEEGETVFAENCAVCHGTDGHGGGGGPDLRTMPLAKTEEGAIQQVTNGGGGMPPFGGQLSEEEIANVAAYVSEKIVGGG